MFTEEGGMREWPSAGRMLMWRRWQEEGAAKRLKVKSEDFVLMGTDHTSLFLWDKLSAPSHCKTFFDNPQNILPPSSSVALHVPTQKTTTARVHKSQKRPCPLTPCPAFDVSSSYPLNTSANKFFFVPSFYSKSVDAFSFPSNAHNSYFQFAEAKNCAVFLDSLPLFMFHIKPSAKLASSMFKIAPKDGHLPQPPLPPLWCKQPSPLTWITAIAYLVSLHPTPPTVSCHTAARFYLFSRSCHSSVRNFQKCPLFHSKSQNSNDGL